MGIPATLLGPFGSSPSCTTGQWSWDKPRHCRRPNTYMPPAAGTQSYNADQPPVMARGYTFTDHELNAMLAEDVRSIVHDEAGANELGALLAGVATTEFANQALGEVLNSAHHPEPWRVGEAIA